MIKNDYYEHKFNSAKNYINKLGTSSIISLAQKNRKVEKIVKIIIQDDVVDEESEDKANMFNDYFISIESI